MTTLDLGGPGQGCRASEQTRLGFLHRKEEQAEVGEEAEGGGNDCNVSTQRCSRWGVASPSHPCHPVLTFVLRQNS